MTSAAPIELSGTQIALRMTHVSKRFGPVQALADVDFVLRRGTVHALVGENGAGKSTLVKILSGVHEPDTGSFEIDDQPRRFENPHQAFAAGVSMIYQDLDLAEDLTVAENVFLGNEPSARFPFMVDRKRMVRQTAELAESFNFQINPTAALSQLSTGDCQIAEILKALARKTSILVMDEPTSSLSEVETERLFETIRNLRRQGISIIYISHRLEEIVDLADDVTVLRDGRVVHHECVSKLDIPQIVHHMVGRELTEFFPSRRVKIGGIKVKVENLSSEDKISGVSFEIRAGEIVGLAGLIGAGRTEIANAIFGIDKKTSGKITLDGRELNISCPTDAIKSGIAYLTEDRKRTGLCLPMTCAQNITLPSLDLIGMKRIIKLRKETSLAAQLGSQLAVKWKSPDAPADSLSGGNQQKLLIARWLLAKSEFMIFDEPTRGIDVGAKQEVYNLLNNLAEQAKAILFISSELPELLGITDRILVMRRGKLVANLVTSQTSQQEIMHFAAVEENT